jgi:SOS-response transcriptional repressor LexA
MEIGNRLEQARKKLGFSTKKVFSERLNLAYQSYVNYEKGERSLPDEVKIGLYNLGINISWLITGQGEPLSGVDERKIPLMEELQKIIEKTVEPRLEKVDKLEFRLSKLENLIKKGYSENTDSVFTQDPEPEYEEEEAPACIPYVEDIAAGPPIPQSEDQGLYIRIPPGYIRGNGDDFYAAGIRGESMTSAGIPDGCTVLIRKADTPRNGAIQVVAYQGRSTLKRAIEREGGMWELHFEDGTNRIITPDSGEYRVQGDFVAVLPPDCKVE